MILENIRRFYYRHIRYRHAELTPKGECFRNYCRQIADDTLEQTIDAYDEFISYLSNIMIKEYGIKFNKKEMAEFILLTYEEIL